MWPLYDKSRRCPKCWGAEVSTEYVEPTPAPQEVAKDAADPAPWIARRCANCDHYWPERPMDQATMDELVTMVKDRK